MNLDHNSLAEAMEKLAEAKREEEKDPTDANKALVRFFIAILAAAGVFVTLT